MLRREWKKLLSNKMMLIVVLAIIAIPTIYTTLFLGSMWDPYGNVDKLPVAVVNEDQPVTYEGETLDVGKQMVDNLKEDGSLDFHFTDADTAREGLEDGTYYMVITIPENFSANAATLTDDKPQKTELSYDTNPGTNYIASKMSATAMEKIESSIREEVTKTYTEAVFDQISEAGDGMQEAADGSGKLKDGAIELAEGNQTITDNLKTLADSSLTFRDGSKTLTEGLKTYVDGVSTVNSGAKELDSGAASLKDGLDQLNGQLPTLTSGVAALSDGTIQLAQGAETAKQGSAALKSGTEQVDDNLQTLNAGLSTLQAATANLPAQTAQLDEGVGSVQAGTESLQAGLQDLQSGVEQLAQSTDTVSSQLQAGNTQALAQIRAGAQSMKDKVDAFLGAMGGVQTLAGSVPTLTGGVSQLADGSSQLKDGTASLVQGTDQLTANNSTLLSGSSQLGDGAKQISDGANLLYEGSQTLGNGMKQIEEGSQTLEESLADGAETVKDTKMGEDTVDMFAAPVDIHETQITTVENNGHAMAPYMMSVALWVGCIAFSLMYPLTKYSGKLTSGTAWWASKASVLYLIAILQAIVMVFMLHVCDGFEPVEMGKTLAVACVASLAFMSVMYFFTNTFGKVGSFLMLVFMVIQLAGSVGTYPLELSGSFVPYLHDWVPFTYTVEAFRSTISGGESIQGAIVFLAVIFVVFTALTILEFQIRTKKIRAKKHTLDEWLEAKGLA